MGTAFFEHSGRGQGRRGAAPRSGTWIGVWSAFDGDRIVGTFRSFPTEITAPGRGASRRRRSPRSRSCRTIDGEESCAGWSPRSTPRPAIAARWRRSSMRPSTRSTAASGTAPACIEATWSLDAATARFHGEPSGSVEIVPLDAAIARRVHRRVRAVAVRGAGEIRRLPYRWDYQFALRTSDWTDKPSTGVRRAPSQRQPARSTATFATTPRRTGSGASRGPR